MQQHPVRKFAVTIIVQVEEPCVYTPAPGRKDLPLNWEDVEWAIRDSFCDDNFTIGAITAIMAEEINGIN